MEKRVLVIRFSSIGDLVLTTGPLAQVRREFPGMPIDLLTCESGSELFINSIDVDHMILLPDGAKLGHLIELYLKMEKYDVVIDLHNNLRSRLFRFFSRAKFYRIEKQSKQRRAFVKNRKFKDKLNKHVVEKYYDTFCRAFPELPALDIEELRPLLPPQHLIYSKEDFDISKSIVVHPYASQKNKEWPYFVDFCNKLVAENIPVIVIGSSEETMDLPSSNMVMNLTNRTTLREISSLIHQARAFVTTDSGPMHLGISVEAPTIALFGPTTKEFGFYPVFEKTFVLEEDLECRPCHVHGGNTCPLEHHNCLKHISVERVIAKIKEVAQ